ncbi:hypothetical protein HK101_000381 [Irineochytrium annulatum]|nr:hypothetical protein HK101_000381 [Irineochytrium annulatum]
MSNMSLPHLVVFTADEENDRDDEEDYKPSSASNYSNGGVDAGMNMNADEPDEEELYQRAALRVARREREKERDRGKPSRSLVSKIPPRTFAVHLLTEPDDVLSLLVTVTPAMLVIEHEGGDDDAREIVKEVLRRIRNGGATSGKRTFIILWSLRAVKDARERSYWTSKGVNMVTDSIPSITQVLSMIQLHFSPFTHLLAGIPPQTANPNQPAASQLHPCPFCGIPLTISHLVAHVPLFHIQEPHGAVCTVCRENVASLPAHMKEHQAQLAEMQQLGNLGGGGTGGTRSRAAGGTDDRADPFPVREGRRASPGGGDGGAAPPQSMALTMSNATRKKPRQPVFALVVVRRASDGKFLMVDEVAAQGWWLPGGGVEVGEDLVKAAERETWEEAGVRVTVKGVLRMEYTPSSHGFRMRVIFYGEPRDPIHQTPKTIPDSSSAGACWVNLDQLGEHIQLRGREPLLWFPYVAKGGAIWPLSIVAKEKDEVFFVQDPFPKEVIMASGRDKMGGGDYIDRRRESSFPELPEF